MLYTIGSKNHFDKPALYSMHRLRADIFKERKGWNISLIAGMDIDGYDALDPLYMLIQPDSGGEVRGCWRLLPTTGPYMLKDTFSALLHDNPAPCSDKIWELSRFAINADNPQSMHFSEVTLEAIRHVIIHGMECHLDSYVTVTTVGVERMLIRLGLDLQRFGPPLDIGVERAVALRIRLNPRTCAAVAE